MNYKEEYVVKKLVDLVRIPSPSGFTEKVIKYISDELSRLGYEPQFTNKGACYVCIGGKGDPVTLAAHVDTLGAMVKSLKGNGRLEITPIGGYMMNSIEGENCEIHTKAGKIYTGTIQTIAPSVHVFENARKLERKASNMEVRLDEIVKSREDLEKLGIETGDFISFDPRVVVTESGFVKSRHLDDKASVAILLAVAKDVSEGKLKLARKTYLFFSNYEEVGHGASSGIPKDSIEVISVDMGAVGDTLGTDEYVVSICAKDSGGPYDSRLVRKLVEKAKEADVDYSVDIYPFYGSDVEASLIAGYDVVFGLIGPGVEASHGYERTHYKALENTIKLIEAYLKD
ncbi:M42 family metallopeptidase [Kosmotoga pacifica]|uniref:Peptidase M42 n=1 Tax=Kosmotoga pacifica TaxID=1330330 RepID=A0A0G2ZG48_9BACT|nr:M42 family metallopeptidase [Kosmotoga pacifica]AKI97788.1 peptidase M42 [Kosmotoga pacifica]